MKAGEAPPAPGDEGKDAGRPAAGGNLGEASRQGGFPEGEGHRQRHRGKALPRRHARHGQQALAGGERFRGGDDLHGNPADAPLREDAREDDEAQVHAEGDVEEVVPRVDRRDADAERKEHESLPLGRHLEPAR